MSQRGLFIPSIVLWFIGGLLEGAALATGIVLTAVDTVAGPPLIIVAVYGAAALVSRALVR